MDILIVVDMQNDFVSGALGTQEAFDIVPYVVGRVAEGAARGEEILFTRDTHSPDYMDTQEGRHLPVPHCIRGSEGWEIIPQLQPDTVGRTVIDKPTFGSRALGEEMARLNEREPVGKITLIGVCTDICVLSNAVLARAACPEAEIVVDSRAVSSADRAAHERALAALERIYVTVVNRG